MDPPPTTAPSAFPVPPDEERRLAALRAMRILDTSPEDAFDGLTAAAASFCSAPKALLVLLDAQRQWSKSRVGEDRTETPRATSFCAHAIMDPTAPLVVPDATMDDRFATNPEVTSGRLRFYAGFPLVTTDGHAVGSLCVIDTVPPVHPQRPVAWP